VPHLLASNTQLQSEMLNVIATYRARKSRRGTD